MKKNNQISANLMKAAHAKVKERRANNGRDGNAATPGLMLAAHAHLRESRASATA